MTLSADNFDAVIGGDKPVLVDFWATWCGPCRMQAPILDEVVEDLADKIVVGKVNVDEEEALAIKYKVSSIPTLMLFKNGKMLERAVGLHSKPQISEMLIKHI